MYESLAGVYDFFAYDFDYDAWTNWYVSLLNEQKNNIKEICDCGCGTGEIAVRLIKKGFRVTGVDLSEGMLAVASDKARSMGVMLPLVKQDMRSLRLPHKTDAIVCACDGVNYLTSLKGVGEFFASAFGCLKNGGVLAFDISNAGKLTKMAQDGLYAEDTEEKSYIWQNSFDENTQTIKMDIRFFIKQQDGRYIKSTEIHTQRAHKVNEITWALEHAGFENIIVYGADQGESQGPGGQRVYFSARKPL